MCVCFGVGWGLRGMELRVGSSKTISLCFIYTAASHTAHVLYIFCVYIIYALLALIYVLLS